MLVFEKLELSSMCTRLKNTLTEKYARTSGPWSEWASLTFQTNFMVSKVHLGAISMAIC